MIFRGAKSRSVEPVAAIDQVDKVPPASNDIVVRLADLPSGVLISGENGALELATERRDDFALIATSNNVVVIIASPAVIDKAVLFDVRGRVMKAGYHATVRQATREIVQLCYQKVKSSAIDIAADATEAERLIGKIINDAAACKASDIHVETRGEGADILFRVNGLRSLYGNVTRATAQALGSVLYSVYADAGSKDVVWNPSDVADGAIEWTTKDGRQLQLRFSSAPIYPTGNFHIVIRLLWMESEITKLNELGYTPGQMGVLDVISSGSNGMILVVGPTGSGKSTTLQSLIGRIYEKRGREIKIITVEDPVEYTIPGACQIPVARNRASLKDDISGSVFTTFLKGTLRQDPDVVMVGEIRDQESVMVTRDLVLAGRKVFATLHAYSALWAFVRLREIGLPWEILTMPNFIAGILYQRLLPILCNKCSLPIRFEAGASSDLMHRLKHVVDLHDSDIRLRGPGCAHCGSTGITGRTVVSEMVLPDHRLLQLLAANQFLEALAYWKKASASYGITEENNNRPGTVLQDAIGKMRLGMVSPVDIENQIGLLTADMSADDALSSDGHFLKGR